MNLLTIISIPESPSPIRALESPADLESHVLSAMRAGDARAFAAALRRATAAGTGATAAAGVEAGTAPPPLSRCVNAACTSPRLAPFLEALLGVAGAEPNAPLRHRPAGAAALPPLHAAAASSNPAALATLLADPRTRPAQLDDARRTALHHAVIPRREDCLERARACVLLLLGQVRADAWAAAMAERDGDCFASPHCDADGDARDATPALVDIDAADAYHCTALHYAARYADERMVLTLLRCGAFMGVRDRFGHSALRDIAPGTLETHLDECLRSKNAKSPQEYMFSLIFSYTFLPNSPSHLNDHHKNFGLVDVAARQRRKEKQEGCRAPLKTCTYASEMSVLVELSNMRCSRHLLKHPVITLFLNMKWHKIKSIYYFNILMYTMFLVSLNYYLISRPGLACLERNSVNFTNFTKFIPPTVSACDENHLFVVEIILIICLIIFMMREGLQMLVSCRKNLLRLEFYLKLLMVCLVVTTLLLPNNTARQHMSALTVLLSWINLFFITGNTPMLSIQLEMLKKVCLTFIKFMTWYSILVIGFSFTFCILLNNGKSYATGSVHSFFLDPWRAIFKTIIMMAGEFDAVDLPLSTFPVTSHIIFIIFVFLISIVLLNLLNGLAVSDTQAIKEEAEVFSLVARVRTISEIENGLLHIHNSSLLNHFMRLGCVRNLYHRIFIFPFFYSSKEIRVYPNWKENNVVISRPDDTNEYFHMCYWGFNRSVDDAIKVIVNRRKGQGGLCVKMTRLRNELRGSMEAMERRLMGALETKPKRTQRFSRRNRASYKSC